MGRPESAIPPGPLESFASGLRALKQAAGLTCREMADKTPFGPTTLSTAASGWSLPSWKVTQAYVEACGGDVGEWRERWLQTQARLEKAQNTRRSPRGSRDQRVIQAQRIARFAASLRALKQNTRLTFPAMANRTGYTTAQFQAAASGKSMPSWPVTMAYVEACGGAVEQWRRRWEQATGQPIPVSAHRAHTVGGDSWIDLLDEVRTLSQLRSLLIRLRSELQLSYAQIGDAARARDLRLPKSSISNLLTSHRVPARQTLAVFLQACGIPYSQIQHWLTAYDRARSPQPPRRRISDVTPQDVGIHPPQDLPYLLRDVDELVRAVILAASHRGGMVLLHGSQGSGKSRCAYEAIQATLPNWWLLQPDTTGDIARFADAPKPQTVALLDPLDKFIPGDLSQSDTINALLDPGAAVVVVGILSTASYNHYLLRHHGIDPSFFARVFPLPDQLTQAELQEAGRLANDDPRMAAAIACGGFTAIASEPQRFHLLATGAELAQHWRSSPNPCTRALIAAAVDAYLLGLHTPLDQAQLGALANRYLTASPVRPTADHIEHGLQYATMRLINGRSPLMRSRSINHLDHRWQYRADDQLLLYLTATGYLPDPPDQVWAAYAQEVADVQDRRAIAHNAQARGLHAHAERLLLPMPEDQHISLPGAVKPPKLRWWRRLGRRKDKESE